MDLLQLTYFCDAAESENFSRTAAKFYVPTSNISQVIRRLEQDVGVPLFDRRGNRVVLNPEGQLFYKRARAALDQLEEARLLLAERRGTMAGGIRLFVGCNRSTVAKAIERFRRDYPNVPFTIDHHHLTDPAGYDLVIADSVPYEGHERRWLVREKFLVAVAKGNALAMQSPISLSTLGEMRFISMHEGSSLGNVLHDACRRAGFEPNIVIRCDDPAYMRRYIEMGLGVALVPSFSWEGLFSGGVVCLETEEVILRDTYVFFGSEDKLTPAARLFVDCLEKTFGAK